MHLQETYLLANIVSTVHSLLLPNNKKIVTASIYKCNQPFVTESGFVFPQIDIAYHTFGNEAMKNKNVVWIFHALTANSDAADWWSGLIGDHRFFNFQDYFIVCANVLGSCYGTTGPLHLNSENGKTYMHQFPHITIRDMVQAHILLRKHLGIHKINVGIGGSLGGQQLLEWAITEPHIFENIVPIATNAHHSPWGIAFNETQRMAIRLDATWNLSVPEAGLEGLKTARAIALLSYRHYAIYEATQMDLPPKSHQFKAISYQHYQGEKLAKRFNAFSYDTLTKAMDSHHLAYQKEKSMEAILAQISAKACCIGLNTDVLFPSSEQKFLSKHIPNAQYFEIETLFGHDGFLLEFEKLTRILQQFFKK